MQKIDDGYQQTTRLFNSIEKQLLLDIEKSNFVETNTALYFNTKKIDLLLASLKVVQEFYTSQAIARVVFEHFLIGQYLWTKSRTENSDQCGKEYRMHYLCSEFFKRASYDLGISNIKNNTSTKIDFQAIKNQHPEMKEMEQTTFDEIHKIANQFEVRKIGDYLANKTEKTDPYRLIHYPMLDFLRRYNVLSSYIHGGPISQEETFTNKMGLNHQSIIKENINWSKIASKQTKLNLLWSLSRDHLKIYQHYLKELTLKP
jgi:hypothetical protein